MTARVEKENGRRREQGRHRAAPASAAWRSVDPAGLLIAISLGALVGSPARSLQQEPMPPDPPSCESASELLPTSRAHGLVVGELGVSGQSTMDILSGADVQVRVERQDLRIEGVVDDVRIGLSEIAARVERLQAELSALVQKDELSKPKPPLTESERKRMNQLKSELQAYSEGRLQLSSAKVLSRETELTELEARDEASKRKPGPPLSDAERARRHEIPIQQSVLSAASERYRRELACVERLVRGRTPERSRKSGRYNFRRSGTLVKVYEGDTLLISVVDIDVNDDDLFGVYAIDVTGSILDNGTLRLPRKEKVNDLELFFRPLRARR